MNWNYRVVCLKNGTYGIKEVYYEKNAITAWSQDFMSPYSEDGTEGLLKDFELMKKAFEKPVLREIDGKLNEIDEIESINKLVCVAKCPELEGTGLKRCIDTRTGIDEIEHNGHDYCKCGNTPVWKSE